MAREARARRIKVVAVLAVALSCGGEVVRLGDQKSGEPVMNAGSGGTSGAGTGSGGAGTAGTSAAGAGTAGASTGGTGAGGTETDGGPDDAAGAGATDAGDSCQHRLVKASEVVWIGDTWIYVPMDIQHNLVRDYALQAGALDPGDNYVVLAKPNATMADIAGQYRAQAAGSPKPKVLIMDGGTWDTISGGGSDASVMAAASDFEDFLAEVASDGSVENIIYFLQPELPNIAGVKELRPYVQASCEQSAVPCHFINLEDVWAGAADTDATGTQANAAGATKIANEIWRVMQDNCIAQ